MGDLLRVKFQSPGVASLGSGPSVLGEARARIPVGGKIRSGIKVLTQSAAKYPKALEIYERGALAGDAWDRVEKAIKEATGMDKSPLTPKNVPWFTARRGDFSMPVVADRIMDLYGEDQGDGTRRLYRFPVLLPLDNWQACMPHGLKCYTRSELVYWSEYGPDGSRYCHTHGKVEVDPRNRRARRVFGGRPVQLRDANDGRCEPDKCPEYQSGACKLSGGLVFYIPGIPGSSAIQLPTTSFYSLSQWRQQMEMVGFLRGRIAGPGPDGRPLFYLAKRLKEVSMIDPETGKPKRVSQYIVALEADVDMASMFQRETLPALSGPEAAALLIHEHESTDPIPSGGDDSPPPQPSPGDIKPLRAQVFAAIQSIGITADAFSDYGRRTWGDGWGTNHDALTAAIGELIGAADDPSAYIARVNDKNLCPF